MTSLKRTRHILTRFSFNNNNTIVARLDKSANQAIFQVPYSTLNCNVLSIIRVICDAFIHAPLAGYYYIEKLPESNVLPETTYFP